MAKARSTRNLTERFRELGLGTKRLSTDRLIDKNGRFNVIKRGIGLRGFSLYHWLINMGWSHFFLFVSSSYLMVNIFFAFVYFMIGAESLSSYNETEINPFLHCFFFSCQTLTTVGYGHISPTGTLATLVAALEAMVGLLGFAFATGILYGRFSKAKSKILFSDHLLVSPYKDIKCLKFRIANMRDNLLIDMEARLMYSFLNKEKGEIKRRYIQLDLEIGFINMFPLPWTIVHPLDEESPLFGKTKDQLVSEKAEFLIILKGHDDTFNQYVHQIHEYNADEVLFDVDFVQMFDPTATVESVVHLNKISEYKAV